LQKISTNEVSYQKFFKKSLIKRLAIVPARGGSKRIKNKNILNFCGKPMISYILDTAKRSNLFKKIHVSTDDNKIRDIVESLGYPIDFMRPEHLADDYTPILPVLKYVTEQYMGRGLIFDQIWLLMACSPFTEDQDFIAADKLFFEAGQKKSVLAVTEYPVPIEWAFTISDNNQLKPVNPGMFATRSQDIKKKYYDTGTFAVFPSNYLLSHDESGLDTEFVGYVMKKGSAIDIDDEEDLAFAEKIFTANQIQNKKK
tara:strand:- start:4121 stop:4888 length:768 start_codon:yes stop_codon:yes gene_type:complete